MTPQEPAQSQKKPMAYPIFLYRLACIGGTARHVPAAGRKMGRNGILIKFDGFNYNPKQQFPHTIFVMKILTSQTWKKASAFDPYGSKRYPGPDKPAKPCHTPARVHSEGAGKPPGLTSGSGSFPPHFRISAEK